LNEPSPAIVAQDAVRRLPRWALLLLCLAYVVPGYVGRDPWRTPTWRPSASCASWRAGIVDGLVAPQPDGPGARHPCPAALALQWAPAWVAPDFAARLPFLLMLAGTWP
jgi:hypothetical protein